MSQIYVLQVGINQYAANVGALAGCVNDVNNLRDYLDGGFEDVHVVQLLDSEATRGNVIQQFREHLEQAKSSDVVLFHYSGHGARWKSAPEFRKFFPGGWDEGLVLHDSRTGGGYDLADKELAILLSKVARNGPHISVLLDCCHSGSATRGLGDFTQLRVRQTHAVDEPRPLETYLDGYYDKQHKKGEPLQVPSSRHILLAACQRKQKAWEGWKKEGVFTSSLLEVLNDPNQDLSYAKIFERCREAVHNRARDQDPQFETYAGFKAYSGFLAQAASAAARRCTVVFDAKQEVWFLDRGAIHGLPTAPDKVTTMEIYATSDPKTPAGDARAVQVGAQKSELEFDGFQPTADANYEAELTSMPVTPMPVELIAPPHAEKRIHEWIDKQADQVFEFSLASGNASTKYLLRVTGGTLKIELRETQALVLGGEGDFEQSAAHVFNALNHIAQWERRLQLQNDATKLDPDCVDLRLVQVVGGVDHPVEGLEFEGNILDEDDSLCFKMTANNTSDQELHMALLFLPESYHVGVPYNMAIDPTRIPFEFTFQSEDGDGPLIYAPVRKGRNESVYNLKLLVSTEKVEDYLLEMDPIKGLGKIEKFDVTRGAMRDRDMTFGGPPRKKITHRNEWFTKSITLRVALQRDRVEEDRDVELADGQIRIKRNPAVKADVALTSARGGTRGVGEAPSFYQALADVDVDVEEDGKMELVNFSRTRGEGGDETILELSEIDVSPNDLKEHPLEIELAAPLKDDEYILPLAFDGESLIVVGRPTKDEQGKVQLSIDEIPETPNKRRSAFKAIKLYFFKCIGINTNQLRWVDYNRGKVVRNRSGVAEKVKNAKSVLVLVHGIIGDTKGIAQGLRLVNVDGTTLDKKFDAILTYDYENLNTSIATTADKLKQQLAKVGIKENDGKHVTFLVHSMGGLVSRWFIEKRGGNKTVDHLVMCGTPNDGSPYGQIGDVRSVTSTLGTLAMSLFPAAGPYVAPVLYVLNGTKSLTPTLEEMKHDSPFMTQLGDSGDPGVRYSVIAGDVQNYDASKDPCTGRLVARVGKGTVLASLFGTPAHDIAVAVQSIRHIKDNRAPKPEKQSVMCHHMNYFVCDAGVAALSNVKW